MSWSSKLSNLGKSTSRATIVSLFLWAHTVGAAEAQELKSRIKAVSSPISIQAPAGWESFNTDLTDEDEILFLQTPAEHAREATVSVALYPHEGQLTELVRKQNHHLLVWEEGPVIVNQALRLRGVPGHKWLYKHRDEDGRVRLYYRLYLLLPESVGDKRLLFLQGVSSGQESTHVLPMFNSLARSLAWGLNQPDL